MNIKSDLRRVAIILIPLFAWYAYGEIFLTERWQYKTTVEIETPEGMKSGSVVRQVTNRSNTLFGISLPDVGSRISNVKGEAVVIDLGKGVIVFGLIEHGSYGEFYSAFKIKNPSNSSDDFKKLKKGLSAQLELRNWPQFVTFTDIKDPKSVILVHGRRFDVKTQDLLPVDDTEKALGPGVKINTITLTITNEPLTWGHVDQYLSKDFWNKYTQWINSTKVTDREFTRLFQFKQEQL